MHVRCTVCRHLYRGGVECIYLGLGDGSVCFGCMVISSDWCLWVYVCSGPLGWAAQGIDKEWPANLPPT